ncbi:MAG: NifB/NifX family molybdenum-iron cluster-binding protein [Candidatus Verstraetearchaeota archaeon]|nr:NifB/NifX family molybdenum-iron cluster-binding protein [Candidatus Verstraetearchaeota archaeon]
MAPERIRIAVMTQGSGGLDDLVSPVFARAPTITFVDVENGEIVNVAVERNPTASAPRGAGIAAVQFLISKGASVALAGQFGPWASSTASQMGIKLLSIPPGTKVRDAVQRYLASSK